MDVWNTGMSRDIILLLVAGGVFALLFVLNAVVRTVGRTERIGFLDTLLAFLTTLVLLAALMANAMEETPLSLVERGAQVIALVLLALSVLIAIAEGFRPQRLRQSRGIFGGVSALLVLIATFTVPFVSNYYALSLDTRIPTPTPIAPTAVADVPTATASGQERALSVFNAVVRVVAQETGQDSETILARLDGGETIANLVQASGGDLNAVIDQITQIMSDQIRQLADEKHMGQAQAAFALSQMEFIVRLGVNQRLDGERFDRLFGGVSATEEAESAITDTPTRVSPTNTRSTDVPSATATLTPTATFTQSPTLTRPPAATLTPTATPLTCQLVMNYNVNLRSAPDLAANVLATIPFTTALIAYGRSEDGAWWFVAYDGRTGWVMDEYVSAAASCDTLPVR